MEELNKELSLSPHVTSVLIEYFALHGILSPLHRAWHMAITNKDLFNTSISDWVQFLKNRILT